MVCVLYCIECALFEVMGLMCCIVLSVALFEVFRMVCGVVICGIV